MLRLELTHDDLGKVTFSPPVATFEMVGSVQSLQRESPFGLLSRWRRSVRRRSLHRVRPLFGIVPAAGAVPEFVVPTVCSGVGPSLTFDQFIAAVLDPMPDVVWDDLDELSGLSPTIQRIAEGDQDQLLRLDEALRAYRDPFLEGWRLAQPLLQAEFARRTHLLVSAGLDEALADLSPQVRWRRPVLEADVPMEITMSAAGQGLRLVPSAFWPRPVFCRTSLTLSYPVQQTPNFAMDGWADRDSLASLLGQTRADVLRALVQAAGTSDLAGRVGISPASASEHARVLRQAGLIATQRQGQRVQHTLTALGLALVQSCAYRRPQVVQPSA